MSTLENHIKDLIRAQGPISIAHYMELCLTHPKLGYYTRRDPLGRAGDFITAPEVSQMFGELVGLFMADYWLALGQPKPFHFIELGPGRGTLMADALRAIKIVPGMAEAAKVFFLEVSPALKKKQKKAVPAASFVETLDEVPPGPAFIIANEFFDCLPIRQFVKSDDGWAERMVGLENDDLAITLSEKALPPNLPLTAGRGAIFEICPQAGFWIDAMATKINTGGGISLVIDYGYGNPGFGDTFQAIQEHAYSNVLKNPGSADLTAHVNFLNLKAKAQSAGLEVYGPLAQGDFLQNIGIEHRAQQLLQKAGKKLEKEILSAVGRLVSGDQMGSLFKVLALTKKDQPEPEGMA